MKQGYTGKEAAEKVASYMQDNFKIFMNKPGGINLNRLTYIKRIKEIFVKKTDDVVSIHH